MNIFPDFTPHCITIMCKQLNSADFRHFIVDELAYYIIQRMNEIQGGN